MQGYDSTEVRRLAVAAESESQVIGHIAFSPVTISDGCKGWYGLCPLSVSPPFQGRGAGQALVHQGLATLRAREARGCVLLGALGYYGRFGFVAIPDLVLPGAPAEFFLCLRFGGPHPRGDVTYDEAFNAQIWSHSGEMPKQYLNPDTLFPSLPHGFSQIVIASGTKTIYISGQTAWDSEKRIIGEANLAEQMRQALRNVRIAVEAAGGTLADVVALRLYIVDYEPEKANAIGDALREFFPAASRPVSTWIGVSALATADFLVEIEATAVLE
ncbi:MAG: GNAT family N-acetyltransferase [Acidobacteriota bacterium]